MPELKEVFTGLLSTAYQMDETGVASLYNEDGSLKDDALQTILSKDSERVTALKGDSKKIAEDQYSRGKREQATALENDLKSVFGIKDSDKKGKELIEAARDLIIANSGKVSDELVKKHPLFLSLEQRVTADVEKVKSEYEGKLTSIKSEYERERTLSEIVDAANVIRENLKPVLPTDAAKSKKQIGFFEAEVKALNYEIQNVNGIKRYLLLDKENKRIEDSHGNPVLFDAKIKEIAESIWDLQAAEKRNGAGDPNNKGAGSEGGNFEFKKPANRDDYNKGLLEIDSKYTDPKQRAEAKKKYMELYNTN